MTRSLVRHALAGLAVVLAACGGGDTPAASTLHLDITPDRASYTAGSTATLTIRNLGDADVGYNPCPRVLQHQVLGGWVTLEASPVLCPFALYVLQPGATATEQMALSPGLAPGRYRVYFASLTAIPEDDAAAADTQSRKASQPFEVTAAP
jgi:hypothetical protein